MALSALLRQQAEDARRRVSLRLDANEDVTGAPLVRKKRRGRPGVATPRKGGLYPLIRAGSISVQPDGFEVTFHELVRLYHEGHAAQPARRIVGFSPRQLDAYKAQVLDELRGEAVRLGIAKG